jgi:hypothetical protein
VIEYAQLTLGLVILVITVVATAGLTTAAVAMLRVPTKSARRH